MRPDFANKKSDDNDIRDAGVAAFNDEPDEEKKSDDVDSRRISKLDNDMRFKAELDKV